LIGFGGGNGETLQEAMQWTKETLKLDQKDRSQFLIYNRNRK